MNISNTYSHFNGLEHILVHKKNILEELKTIVSSVDAEKCKTKSREKSYSSIQMNKEFKKLFKQKNWKVNYSQRGFMKGRISVELQFRKHPSVNYDLLTKHLAFYVGDTIDVGVEILPVKSLQKNMSSGVALL